MLVFFCHVYLNISNCPLVIAVVLFQYTVLSCTSAPIDDPILFQYCECSRNSELLLSNEELDVFH